MGMVRIVLSDEEEETLFEVCLELADEYQQVTV